MRQRLLSCMGEHGHFQSCRHFKTTRNSRGNTHEQVALTCLISLRQNDDGSNARSSGDGGEGTSGGASSAPKPPLNQGCERVIRFCSPSNVASTLTPAHFAQVIFRTTENMLHEKI